MIPVRGQQVGVRVAQVGYGQARVRWDRSVETTGFAGSRRRVVVEQRGHRRGATVKSGLGQSADLCGRATVGAGDRHAEIDGLGGGGGGGGGEGRGCGGWLLRGGGVGGGGGRRRCRTTDSGVVMNGDGQRRTAGCACTDLRTCPVHRPPPHRRRRHLRHDARLRCGHCRGGGDGRPRPCCAAADGRIARHTAAASLRCTDASLPTVVDLPPILSHSLLIRQLRGPSFSAPSVARSLATAKAAGAPPHCPSSLCAVRRSLPAGCGAVQPPRSPPLSSPGGRRILRRSAFLVRVRRTARCTTTRSCISLVWKKLGSMLLPMSYVGARKEGWEGWEEGVGRERGRRCRRRSRRSGKGGWRGRRRRSR